ncbi:MAG: helix-turn-helix transcriptional regulator [Pseudomonadota bacterium]
MLTQDRLRRLCRARDNLREVGPEELAIAEVAKAAAMSRFHFIRQFRAVFGESPSQFRTRERLNRAKQLLALEGASVTDVCMAVGFSSLGSFSALFTRRFGLSPSMYRKRLAGSAQQPKPVCMDLLRSSWESEPQISRSPD